MKPQIAAPLFGNAARCEHLAGEAKNAGADILELRFDLCAKKITPAFCADVASYVHNFSRLQKIATFRIREEGGWEIFNKHSERQEFYKAVLPYVSFVDVEIAAKDKDDIIRMAKSAGKKIIISVHDLRKMLSEKRMDSLLKEGFSLGADMVKLAFFAKTQMDALSLLEFTCKHRKESIITVALGPQGVFTRILAGVFGSHILYGHIGRASFPHQLSVKQIAQALKDFGCR